MKQELISVIIPVYNVESFLRKCINSVISQTYNNLEIILVDDGSTDESGVICDQFANMDTRIRVIHKENTGLSDARNVGMKIAQGKYWSFIDSDDYIMPETISKLYYGAINNKCEIAVCNMVRVYEDGTNEPFYHPSKELQVLNGNKRFETLKQPSVCNKLFLASLFNGLEFPKDRYYEDTYVYHELAYRSNNIAIIGFDGYWYLSRNTSILGQVIYTDRYFDFIDAVWHRAYFLIEHNVQPYGNEACLSLYVAIANATKYIQKKDNNRELFVDARNKYNFAYKQLMNERKGVSFKQKLRLVLLKCCPSLHNRIY